MSESRNLNPAARLHTILSAAKAQPPSHPTGRVWKEALGIKVADQRAFLHAYTQLLVLYQDTIISLEEMEGIDQKLYLSWKDAVATVLSIENLQKPWEQTSKPLAETHLQALQFADSVLSRSSDEQGIPKQQLEALQSKLDELLADVVDAKIDRRVKLVLVQQINNLKLAIMAYRIRGAAAVSEALERAFGAVVLNVSDFKGAKASDVIQRFKDILVWAYKLTATALKLKKEVADPLLELMNPSEQ